MVIPLKKIELHLNLIFLFKLSPNSLKLDNLKRLKIAKHKIICSVNLNKTMINR